MALIASELSGVFMPRPSSTMVSAGAVASVASAMRVAPESSALATISVRIVSSGAFG